MVCSVLWFEEASPQSLPQWSHELVLAHISVGLQIPRLGHQVPWAGSPLSFSVTLHVCAWSLSHVQLFNPMDCHPPGPSVHGIFQARILEWVAISFSRGSSPPGTEPESPALKANSLPSEPPGKPQGRSTFTNYTCNDPEAKSGHLLRS